MEKNLLYLLIALLFSTFIYLFFKKRTRAFYKIIPILIFVGIIIYLNASGLYQRNKFIKNDIKSTITDSDDWQQRTIEYYLKNGTTIYSTLNSFNLQIGDSISKEANSSLFYVYRKNYIGKYEFYNRYDYNSN
jgi:energy-coupling factor transporter transmembrane protein EcfT